MDDRSEPKINSSTKVDAADHKIINKLYILAGQQTDTPAKSAYKMLHQGEDAYFAEYKTDADGYNGTIKLLNTLKENGFFKKEEGPKIMDSIAIHEGIKISSSKYFIEAKLGEAETIQLMIKPKLNKTESPDIYVSKETVIDDLEKAITKVTARKLSAGLRKLQQELGTHPEAESNLSQANKSDIFKQTEEKLLTIMSLANGSTGCEIGDVTRSDDTFLCTFSTKKEGIEGAKKLLNTFHDSGLLKGKHLVRAENLLDLSLTLDKVQTAYVDIWVNKDEAGKNSVQIIFKINAQYKKVFEGLGQGIAQMKQDPEFASFAGSLKAKLPSNYTSQHARKLDLLNETSPEETIFSKYLTDKTSKKFDGRDISITVSEPNKRLASASNQRDQYNFLVTIDKKSDDDSKTLGNLLAEINQDFGIPQNAKYNDFNLAVEVPMSSAAGETQKIAFNIALREATLENFIKKHGLAEPAGKESTGLKR